MVSFFHDTRRVPIRYHRQNKYKIQNTRSLFMLVKAHGWRRYYQNLYLAQALISLMPSPVCSIPYTYIYLLLKNFYGRWYDIWFYRIFKRSEDTHIIWFCRVLEALFKCDISLLALFILWTIFYNIYVLGAYVSIKKSCLFVSFVGP